MSVQMHGIVKDGLIVPDLPLSEGAEVTILFESVPIAPAARKTTDKMSEAEFAVWLNSIWGSVPDMEEPPDLPLNPVEEW